jgi:putative transposase
MHYTSKELWIHAIWSTKDPIFLKEESNESQIYNFIKNRFIDLGCPVRAIGGMPGHIQCLFVLNHEKSITEIFRHVKGSSSRFINKNGLTAEKFRWQIGYIAFSVSESTVPEVYEYISTQKTRNENKTFKQECVSFFKFHGMEEKEK